MVPVFDTDFGELFLAPEEWWQAEKKNPASGFIEVDPTNPTIAAAIQRGTVRVLKG